MITAAVGVWSSYQQVIAFRLFLLVGLSGGLYFYLSRKQAAELWIVPPILSAIGVVLVSVFLLTQDWHQFKADLEVINRIGSWWMTLRPTLSFKPPHQNMVAGLLAIIIPLDIVWLIRERSHKNRRNQIIVLVVIGFLTLGLVLTSSRGAWFSLLIGLGVGAGLGLSGSTSSPKRSNQKFIGLTIILVMIIIATVGIAGWLSYHAGPFSVNSLDSRIDVYRNALELARDQWITGGGLGSFAGLYSSYILILPVPIFFYSHNLYLGVLIEQGVFGLIAWITIITLSILLLIRSLSQNNLLAEDRRLLTVGVLSSLSVLFLHGLIDNPLYAEWGRPFLFVLPGMALSLSIDDSLVRNSDIEIIKIHRNFALIVLLVIAITITVFNRPIRSAWFANIGSIIMAKTHLADWPTGKWPEKSMGEKLGFTKQYFEKSLDINASNLTSNYRLGLIDFYGQEFSQAERYLSRAYQLDQQHRGIRKTLGYTYAWLGEFDLATGLLRTIPEAKNELGVYTWWWTTQDRNDLAQNAGMMIERLEEE